MHGRQKSGQSHISFSRTGMLHVIDLNQAVGLNALEVVLFGTLNAWTDPNG